MGSSSGPLTGAPIPADRLAGVDLGVEDRCCSAVLVGQPVVGRMQVDPGGLDRGMAGLGLHGLECHPGLPEPGQAGVPQLVAGVPRDAVVRRLAHEPFGWRPTTLLVTLRRYRCTGCGHV